MSGTEVALAYGYDDAGNVISVTDTPMGEAGVGQPVAANFWLIVGVLVAVAAADVVLVVRRRRKRVLPATVDGIRFECQDVRVDADLVVEQCWRASFLLVNVTKRPVRVPPLGARGTLVAAGREYAGTVFVEREVDELNPRDHLLAWLTCRLPAGGRPAPGVITASRRAVGLSNHQ